jgi:hypothetical protein
MGILERHTKVMPQDKKSGARAAHFGKDNAERIAGAIGAKLVNPKKSNLALYKDRRVVLKSARIGNNFIGIPYSLLAQVSAVIAAFEREPGDFVIIELSEKKFRQEEKPQPGREVGQVPRKVFFAHGVEIGHFDTTADEPRRPGQFSGWIFQANPDNFAEDKPLDAYLCEACGRDSTWYVGQHHNKIEPGQPVFVWQAQGRQGLQRGLIAYGTISAAPKPTAPFRWELKYERRPSKTQKENRAVLRIHKTLLEPGELLTREALMADQSLRNLRIFNTPRGSNFPLTEHQVNRLWELLSPKTAAVSTNNNLPELNGSARTLLVRLSFNSGGWKKPTGEAKRYEAPSTFNHINGFGYEDWLFRTDWHLDGWHYGFIQAFNNAAKKYRQLALDVTLFTIEPDKRRRCVADIFGLEVLDGDDAQAALKAYREAGWFNLMREEVEDIKGDANVLNSETWAPNILNVRFRPENVRYSPPNDFFTAGDWLSRRWRYKPYALTDGDRQRIARALWSRRGEEHATVGRTTLRRGCAPVFVDPIHKKMAVALEKELKKEYPACRIMHEEDYVDLSVETNAGLVFFELKSDLSARMVIRQALGQILEYAFFLPQKQEIQQLVIVGRSDLTNEERRYFDRLKKFFPIPIGYRKVSV